MTWDESKHPRDDIGRFTYSDGGDTGTSEGPHLHITIRENKIQVNPRKYLNYFNK